MGFFFLALPAYILIAFVLGSFVNIHNTKNPWFNLFLKLFWGSLMLGVLYALMATRGVSLYLILIILVVLLFRVKTDAVFLLSGVKQIFSLRLQASSYLLPGVIIITVFFLQFFRVFDLAGDVYAIHSDFLYYGRLAYYISEKGIESHAFDVFSQTRWAPSMYHYLEIWQTALIARIFNLNMSLTLYLVVYPFYFLLSIVGLLGFFNKQYAHVKLWHYGLAFLVLFVAAFGFADVTKLLSHIFAYGSQNNAMYNYPKLGVVFVIIVYVINLKPRPSLKFGFLISVFGLMWPAVIPALFSAYVIWALLLRFFTQNHQFKFFHSIVFPFITALLFFLFYVITSKVFSSPVVITEQSGLSSIKDFYWSRYGIVSVFYIMIFATLSVISTLSLYLAYFYWVFSARSLSGDFKDMSLFLFLMIVFGVTYHAGFIYLFNSWQLQQNILVPVVGVALIVYFFEVFRSKAGKIQIAIGVLLLVLNVIVNLIFYQGGFTRGNKLDKDFYSSLVEEYRGFDDAKFAFFKNYHEEMSVTLKNPRVNMTGLNAALFINEFSPVSFSVFDTPITNDPVYRNKEIEFIQSGFFYQYVQHQKADGVFDNLEQSMLDFAKEHNVRFVFFETQKQIPANFFLQKHTLLMNEAEGFGVMILE